MLAAPYADLGERLGAATMTDENGDRAEIAAFLLAATVELGSIDQLGGCRVLDFCCGAGALIDELVAAGLDAQGTDMPANLGLSRRLLPIEPDPYRLPFGDATFDVVVSTSVFEHAQNTEACFQEIHRILRPGGVAMHTFPGKWYLPSEPHIYVPLVNWLWPRRPRWWLSLWARLGIRNEYQAGMFWPEVVDRNDAYMRDGLCYRSTQTYTAVSRGIFDDVAWPMWFYIAHAPGSAARLARRLPWRRATGVALREFRTAFLVQLNAPAAASRQANSRGTPGSLVGAGRSIEQPTVRL